jgi:hypothetical protein
MWNAYSLWSMRLKSLAYSWKVSLHSGMLSGSAERQVWCTEVSVATECNVAELQECVKVETLHLRLTGSLVFHDCISQHTACICNIYHQSCKDIQVFQWRTLHSSPFPQTLRKKRQSKPMMIDIGMDPRSLRRYWAFHSLMCNQRMYKRLMTSLLCIALMSCFAFLR